MGHYDPKKCTVYSLSYELNQFPTVSFETVKQASFDCGIQLSPRRTMEARRHKLEAGIGSKLSD